MSKYQQRIIKYIKIIALSASPLFLASCETLSREECLYGSWYELGVKDGRMGKPLDLLGRHQHACAEYGVKINNNEYQAGRSQGLVGYCQLSNAFNTGLQGDRYQGVCPPEIDGVFNRYNDAAYQVYQQREILRSLESNLASKESSLSSKKTPDDKKQRIRDEIKQLEREHRYVRDELYTMERRLDQLMDESRH
jgi:hypothetical protein